MTMMILGDGVVLRHAKAEGAGWMAITTAWAFAVMAGVFAATATGSPDAHLNPAITVASVLMGGPANRLWTYIPARLIGAVVGTVVVWLHDLPHGKAMEDAGLKLACFCTGPAIRDLKSDWISEIIGTFVLVIVISVLGSKAVGTSAGIPTGLSPYLVGMIVWGVGGAGGNVRRGGRDIARVKHWREKNFPLGLEICDKRRQDGPRPRRLREPAEAASKKSPILTFPSIPLPLARTLAARGYDEATPVQAAVIAADAANRDLVVSAQTGSGKTVAYGIALADTLLRGADTLPAEGPLALIIAPTRELALQVQRELAWLYGEAGASIVACVGGMDPRAERRALERGAHIVVGTPGRLRDHVERRALNMDTLRAVVLDEADEMLDLGFREDLEFILEATPAERRTLLFSATLPKAIVALATRYQRDALRIETGGKERGHADIEYRVVRVVQNERVHAIVNILRQVDSPSAIIFCNTRESVRHLSAMLQERGFAAVTLSGELSQNERNHALQALRDHRARVCVATDVAARGLDLPNLGLVIHADLPTDPQTLQHRSGRTGRAGRKGISMLLAPPASQRRADRLLDMAGLTASWSGPPTVEEIRALDQQRLLEDPMLTGEASEDDLTLGRRLLEGASAEKIAAALVRVYRARLPDPEDVSDPGTGRDRPARKEPRENREVARESGYDRNASQGNGGVWFRLDIGRKKNADPKWLLPMLCKRGGVTKRDIGTIRIFDKESKVEIMPRVAEAFAAAVAGPPPPGENIRIERTTAPGGVSSEGPRPKLRPGYKPRPKDEGAARRKREHAG